MSLQIRRGLEADRLSVTPLAGEFLYTTDEKKLYIGDGTTPGGNLVADMSNFYTQIEVDGLISGVESQIPDTSGKEDTSNKSTNVATDQASNAKYPSVKAVFDWVMGLGFITNVATALGYTPENTANKKTNFSSPNDTDYPTTKAVNDAKEDKATATTGNAISFTTPQVYNSLASPGTGDITENLTGARIGVVQKIYHNKLVAPTFPAGWVRLGSTTYNAGNNNIIYAEWVSGTRVEYWIVRL